MKKSLLFTLCSLLFVSVTSANADTTYGVTPVVSGGGGNLTSFYNTQGSVNNNAYNQMMNPSRQSPSSAKIAADFGNCNALILRCASPKCGGSGCVDMAIAVPIVSGCVMDSEECKKHGDPLIQAVAASLVASSTAKANAAASSAAANQSTEQIQQLSQQIEAMQQQANEERAANQQALEEQQQRTEALLASQQQQTTVAAAATTTESMPEISSEMITRQQIVGQIMGALDGVNSSMQTLKKTVQDVLDYAKCDYNATNCGGPRRIAAFRKKAQGFFEPYDNVLNSLEDSIYIAMASGVDVTDIYMMMTDSCSQWGKLLCPSTIKEESLKSLKVATEDGCTILELYRNDQRELIQQNFIAANSSDDPSNIKLICLNKKENGLLGNNILFSYRRGRSSNSTVDVDALELIINQTESENEKIGEARKMCAATVDELKTAVNNKKYEHPAGKKKFDGTFEPNSNCWDDGKCVANPLYAICNTHIYNLNDDTLINNNMTSEQRENMKDVIAMKSTIIARMLKQQSDYLETTVRQLKIQLQKAVLTSGGSQTSPGTGTTQLAGAQNCAARNPQATLECLRTNYQVISAALSSTGSVSTVVKDQITRDWSILKATLAGLGSTYPSNYDESTPEKKNLCDRAKLASVKGAQECLDIQMAGGFTAIENALRTPSNPLSNLLK